MSDWEGSCLRMTRQFRPWQPRILATNRRPHRKSLGLQLGAQGRLALRAPKADDSFELFFDQLIHFALVVIVVRETAMNLPERQVRMLSLDFVGVPVMCQAVQRNLDDLGLRTDKPELTVRPLLDVGIAVFAGHRKQS